MIIGNSRALYGVILSQFFATFIEYAMKLMVFTLATRPIFAAYGYSSHYVATLAAFAFLIPMLLFSFPAGMLVDRFCMRSMIITTKVLDVLFLSATTLCLYLFPHQVVFPFIMLGLLGISSALFNPAKGSMLPEILGTEKLGKGNGLLEMWTMLAVFAGYALGPALLSADNGGIKANLTWVGPGLLTVMALISLVIAFFLPKFCQKMEGQREGFFKTMRQAVVACCKDYALALMLAGNVLFWIVITYFGQNVLVETKALVSNWEHSEVWQGVPLAAYWLGIAVGSLGGGRLPVERICTGPKITAVLWFSVVWVLYRLIQPGFVGASSVLLLMGLAAGFLIVPIMAIIQHKAPKRQRGSILAFNNVLNIIGILLGSYIAMQLN